MIVLEKIYGKRCLLICENATERIGHTSIRLSGDNLEKSIECDFLIPKNCFSVPNTVHVLLSEVISQNEFDSIKAIEIVQDENPDNTVAIQK